MIAGSIARRYAKALLAIAVEQGRFEEIGQEVERFTALLESRELKDTLENPSYPLSKRKAVLKDLMELLRPSESVQSLLLLLLDRNRIPFLPAISREYRLLADQHAGRVRAAVVSVRPLDPATVDKLKNALEKMTARKVMLEQRTDPEIIGGIVTRIGSMVYDGSIRTGLERLRHSLLAGEK